MENVLELKSREGTGTKSSRNYRDNGDIPGVLYGKGNENKHFIIEERKLQEVLRHHEKLVKVQIEKEKPVDALIHSVQYEPVSGSILHFDLHIVKMDEEIQVSVPLEMIGAEVSPGAGAGGTVELIIHEVSVTCLPANIPENIDVDVSAMEVGETKLISNLVAPQGVKIDTDPEEIMVVVHEPVDIEAETDVEESLKALGEEPTVQKQKEDADEEGAEAKE